MAKPRGGELTPIGLTAGYSDDGQVFELAVRLRTEDVIAYMRSRNPSSPENWFGALEVVRAVRDDGLIEVLRLRREGAPRKWDAASLLELYDRRGPKQSMRALVGQYLETSDDAQIRAGVQALRQARKGRTAEN